MIHHFKKLGTQTVIYGLGDALIKAVVVFLIPLYTKYLSTDEYGVYSILQTLQMILVLILGLGFQSAIFKVYNESDSEEHKNDTIATGVITYMVWGLFITGVLLLLSKPIALLFFNDPDKAVFNDPHKIQYLRLLIGAVFFDLFRLMILSLFRAWERPLLFIIVNLANFILLVTLNIVNVAIRKKGLLGIWESQLLTSIIIFSVLVLFVLRKIRYRFSLDRFKALLHFGLPLVPSGIAAWSLSMTGQYFLHFYHTDHEVGLYGLGWRFGAILNMLLVNPFRTAWLPFLFSIQKDENARRIYSLTFTFFTAAGLFVFLGISLLSKEIVEIASSNDKFDAGYQVVPFIALAYLFYGLFYIVDVGVLITGKTKYYALVTAIVALIQIGIYRIVVPYSTKECVVINTAAVTTASYFILFLLMFAVSQRLFPMQYEWKRIIKIVLVGIIIFIVGLLIRTGSLAQNIILKLILVCSFPFLLWCMRFYQPAEWAVAIRWLNRRKQSRSRMR